MDECCAACCPSPDYPVFRPSPKALRWRMGLKFTIYGELIHVISRCILWGMTYGMFQLINVWIDYMAFATMHFCQCMIVGISGAMDLMMLLMYRDRSYMLDDINESTFNTVLYWYCVAFSVAKIIISIGSYICFKAEFKTQHGHSSICPGPQMRGQGGFGGPRRSLFDQGDNEQGYNGNAYGQRPQNNFTAFSGTGTRAFGNPQPIQPQQQYGAMQQNQGYGQAYGQPNQAYGQQNQAYGQQNQAYGQPNQQVYGQQYQPQQVPPPPQYGEPVITNNNVELQYPASSGQPDQQTGAQNAAHNNYWRNRGAGQKLDQ